MAAFAESKGIALSIRGGHGDVPDIVNFRELPCQRSQQQMMYAPARRWHRSTLR
jgi:hypothetical protein